MYSSISNVSASFLIKQCHFYNPSRWMIFILPLPFLCCRNIKHLRVGAVLFTVRHGQVPAVHNKYVELSKLLDVVHSKLDASLDFNVSKVCRADAAGAAADLLITERTIITAFITLIVFLFFTFVFWPVTPYEAFSYFKWSFLKYCCCLFWSTQFIKYTKSIYSDQLF